MTGEMYQINQETGEDDSGNIWASHLAIAKAVGGELKPFDQYQGPYIAINGDITMGDSPYSVPIPFPERFGLIRLWLFTDPNGDDYVYREDNGALAPCIGFIPETCIEAARSLLEGESDEN